MKFFKQSEIDTVHNEVLSAYDAYVRENIPENYKYPIRLRDWELSQLIRHLDPSQSYENVLDTGCVNTFLPVWLSQFSKQVFASDLLTVRVYKNIMRRIGIVPRKATEAPIGYWHRSLKHKRKNIRLMHVDLTKMPFESDYFDLITSVSVIEHIPKVERALAEMYRCLKPGGKLLLTTDCMPESVAYKNGVRYFDENELRALFAEYPVTSPYESPSFVEENWCYKRDKPLVTAFIEITKE